MPEPDSDPGGLVGLVDGLATMAVAPALEPVANVVVALDGATLRLTSITGRVRIDVETFEDALDIVWHEQAALERLDATLTAAGFTAEVYVGGTHAAWLGADADPGWGSRYLADGCTELRPAGVSRVVVDAPGWRGRLPSTGVGRWLDGASRAVRRPFGRERSNESAHGTDDPGREQS